jgi:hypothetical protein
MENKYVGCMGGTRRKKKIMKKNKRKIITIYNIK